MAYQFFHIEAYSLQAKSYEREITIKKEPRQARKKNQENRDKKHKRNHGGASSNR